MSLSRTTPSARTRVLAHLLRPVLAESLRHYLRRQRRPTHHDRALVIGPHPLRVLIVGAGLAVGYGSADDVLTLPAQLARALERELGRGIVVECRSQASVRLDRTIELLGMAGAATFDVVVWSPTLEEAFTRGAGRWVRTLDRIVGAVQATGARGVRVILLGVPGSDGTGLLQRLGAVLAAEVDAGIASVAAGTDRVEFLPVPPRTIDAWDTPLFDSAYQARVIDDLVALLARSQRQAAIRAAAHPVEITDHGTWSSV